MSNQPTQDHTHKFSAGSNQCFECFTPATKPLDELLAECGKEAGTGNLTYGQIQAVKKIVANAEKQARIDELRKLANSEECVANFVRPLTDTANYVVDRIKELENL